MCPIHPSFFPMSGPRSLAVPSDSISTTPLVPVASWARAQNLGPVCRLGRGASEEQPQVAEAGEQS